MVWDKPKILHELRRLDKGGKALSYNALARSQQSLVSAAAYHFGSYRRAVEQAGIDYATVTRRPRWTRKHIITLIKKARRADENLHWSAVTQRRDELGKAAFASLQPRLFGRWDRALHAAGLDADDISRYRRWDRNSIVSELKSRYRDAEALNSGAIQADDPGLHAAAVRHFSSYDAALRAAKFDPTAIRKRRNWSRADVIGAIKQKVKIGSSVADGRIREESPALYGAAMRLFGTFTAARNAAGVEFKDKRGVGSKPRNALPGRRRAK